MQKRELNEAMDAVLRLISKESTDEKTLADVLSKILGEGITLAIIVDRIIECRHEREAAGLSESVTLSDLTRFSNALRESTPDNRERWERRFKTGQARYWCPECGFSGDGGDFRTLDSVNVVCMVCGCFKDERYFTRTWSADEQAAFEAEQERMRPILAAQEKREADERERAKNLEPKVAAILKRLDGVGKYINEAEEQAEVAPYIRAIVHRTARTADEIVAKWQSTSEVAAGLIPPVEIAKAVNRVMLREGSMQNILDHLDDLGPSELEPLEAGEERYFFTREELVHEVTYDIAKWDAILNDREIRTTLMFDGRFVISIMPKGWSEAHLCPCDDCKAKREEGK